MKKIKPVDIDLHLKYLCPNCGAIVWLSLKETQTPRYISVCDLCNNSFRIKTIDKITIKYKELTKQKKETVEEEPVKVLLKQDIKEKAINSLVSYGFTKTESAILLQDAFDIFQTNDIGILVKESLKLFGVKNG
jgi:DNA-directed RNA polymerase subunit M/transcription elongation factor TFIIS